MDLRDSSKKLPVPGAWQPQVVLAMNHLAERLGVGREAVAVTRVEKLNWRGQEGDPCIHEGLEIWLIGAGKSYRYRAGLSSASPALLPEPS